MTRIGIGPLPIWSMGVSQTTSSSRMGRIVAFCKNIASCALHKIAQFFAKLKAAVASFFQGRVTQENVVPVTSSLVVAEPTNKGSFLITLRKVLLAQVHQYPGLASLQDVENNAEAIDAWLKGSRPILQSIRELNLSHQGLKEIPEEIKFFTGLTKLDLSNNSIAVIAKESFIELGELKMLLIYSNNLCKLLPGAFVGLGKLEYLFLEKNKLTTIDQKVFNDLVNLKDLNLGHNRILAVDDVVKSFATDGKERDIRIFLHGNPIAETLDNESKHEEWCRKIGLKKDSFFKVFFKRIPL